MELKTELKIEVNAKPLRAFIELFKHYAEARKLTLNLGDLPLELARVDSNSGSTSAGVLVVTLYPSDAFLDFAATVNADL